MKTALVKLIQLLESDGYRFDFDVINNAFEEEKQQIIEAHNKGQQYYNPGYNPNVSEQYYNETFKNNP